MVALTPRAFVPDCLLAPRSEFLEAPGAGASGSVLAAAALAVGTLALALCLGCNSNAGLPTELTGLAPELAGLAPELAGMEAKPTDDGLDAGADGPPAGTFVPGRLLVKFKAGASAADEHRALGAANARVADEIPQLGVKIVELPAGASETAQARAFGAQAQVEFAELDELRAADATANDPYFGNEWHLTKIAAPAAWDTTTGSGNVIIAILDTGCDPTHPDLMNKYVPGWNFYDNNNNTSDVYGHGTGVAGSAAAQSNNGTGVASPAWACKIMPLRISSASGSASFSTAATALSWAADHGARVANISYIMTNSSTVTSAAQYMQSRGGVVTISAGNNSTFDATADNPYVLTISATDQSDVLASWSNTGNNVDLSAPGFSIAATIRGGGYGAWSGTSFSAPIVAGVAALMISVNPSLTAAQVQDLLKQSADDLGPAGWDPSYGSGRVNAAQAVALAVGSGTPPPDTTPPTAGFSTPSAGSTVSGTVTVQVSATDNVAVASVGLYVDGGLFATDTSSPYSFACNTTALANGGHTLMARAADAAGNSTSSTISVTVSNFSDIQSPTVAITSPANGATVRRTINVTVSATDNIGVTRVELFVDGVLKATSTGAPFTNRWNTNQASSGAHALQTKAYDAAGNRGDSQIVTVYK